MPRLVARCESTTSSAFAVPSPKGKHKPMIPDEHPEDIESSLLTFAEKKLKVGSLYGWQSDAIEPFDEIGERLVMVSVVTPNESGKSSIVIPSIVLGVLTLYPRAKVVCTSADGKQIDGQVMPALEAHRSKFPAWKWIEREILTPGEDGSFLTGGRFIAFSSDDPGKVEGWQPFADATRETGPLVMIVDEAKSLKDEMFVAIDRCGYAGLLLTSSPGRMGGRFYESHTRPEMGFRCIKAGLLDCPHIKPEKIARIEATYRKNSSQARSILHGEFTEAEGELKFDPDGLAALQAMVDVEEAAPTARVGRILEQERSRGRSIVQFAEDASGWLWMIEPPTEGCSYVGFCDPQTGAQSEGSLVRDMASAGILRAAYIDERKVEHDVELVAILHAPSGVRWHNDVLAERLSLLLRLYGDPTCIVEANNSGPEVMRLLLLAGRTLWKREKPNHRVPGKQMLEIVGFLTTTASRNLWVGALSVAISGRWLVCRYGPAVKHFKTFIIKEDGRAEAAPGTFDDHVTGVGLGLFALPAANRLSIAPAYATTGEPGYYAVSASAGPWS